MIYLENSVIGTRVAVYYLTNDSNISFYLIPMVHIAIKEFYDEVQSILEKSNKIIVEGVISNKWYNQAPSYKKVGENLGLTSQHEGINYETIQDKIIFADIDAHNWDQAISKVSVRIRLMIFFIDPILKMLFHFEYFQKKIIKRINVEDLEDYENDSQMNELLIKIRNKYIFEKIVNVYKEIGESSEENIISLVYGAKHCPTIFHLLSSKLNYKVSKSWYLTVHSVEW
jgi:hypothetical protein